MFCGYAARGPTLAFNVRPSNVDGVEIVLLLGFTPFRLDERTGKWLSETIRVACADDEDGSPNNTECAECLRLADVLEGDLARGHSPEPIELGHSLVEGLAKYVLRDYLVQEGEPELTALYYALRRYRGDPV